MEISSLDGEGRLWPLSLLLSIFLSPSPGVYAAMLAVVVLIICSALVSGSEVAYFSLFGREVEELRIKNSKSSIKALNLLRKPRFLLASILIANNLINVAIVVISYFVFENTLDLTYAPWLEFLVNVVIVTFILLLFGEVMPKVYSTKNNLKVTLFMAYPLSAMNYLFYPLSYVLVKTSSFLENRLRRNGANNTVSVEEIEYAIDLTTDPHTTQQEVDILKGIVKFGNIMTKQIMCSRIDMIAVETQTNYAELLNIIHESGYSRIPVYKEDLDHVEGVLYVKDLLQHLDENDSFEWQSLLRPASFVPENKKIDDLLREMQENRVHLAMVVDEYGGTSGLITLEDILEEVIGEIKDEYDLLHEIEFQRIDDHNFIFEGKTALNDICKVIGVKEDVFDEVRGEADSLGGLILEIGGTMPSKGEERVYDNFVFTVMTIGENRIKKVKVTINDDE